MKTVCKVCGKEFIKKNKDNIYCSRTCHWESLRSKKVSVCKNCNNEFPYRADATTFCSRKCSGEWKSKTNKGHNEKPKGYTLTCPECNEIFKSNRKRKYCSFDCYKAHSHKALTVYTKLCKQCGNEFDTTNYRINYCCETCRKKQKNRFEYVRRDKRLTRNGKRDYSITLEKLCKRDNGVCYICGEKVDMNADTNNDLYGSIDHVIPISKGGTHTWDNVKLAHRTCNALKSDKLISLAI